MMERLKLPAYGKRLLAERRAGRHPLEVNLCYGDRWREVAAPLIAIEPKDYEPGKYHFFVLAGLHVVIYDQLAGGWDMDPTIRPPTYGKFYDLAAEVAVADAWVTIRWPKGTSPPESDLQALAWECRWWSMERRAFQWPPWWSDMLEAKHQARWQAWMIDAYPHAFGRARARTA